MSSSEEDVKNDTDTAGPTTEPVTPSSGAAKPDDAKPVAKPDDGVKVAEPKGKGKGKDDKKKDEPKKGKSEAGPELGGGKSWADVMNDIVKMAAEIGKKVKEKVYGAIKSILKTGDDLLKEYTGFSFVDKYNQAKKWLGDKFKDNVTDPVKKTANNAGDKVKDFFGVPTDPKAGKPDAAPPAAPPVAAPPVAAPPVAPVKPAAPPPVTPEADQPLEQFDDCGPAEHNSRYYDDDPLPEIETDQDSIDENLDGFKMLPFNESDDSGLEDDNEDDDQITP